MIKPSITLKSLATSVISCAGLITVVADRSTAIVDNTLGMVDDLAADGKDATAMSKLDNMTERRAKYTKKYKDAPMPDAFKLLMNAPELTVSAT
ncbi:MAG: hypothetical protein GY861_00795 [bacterium]|nr:hypothetical protein [bacterium]